MKKYKKGEKVYWTTALGREQMETVLSMDNDKVYVVGGGFLYTRSLHENRTPSKPRMVRVKKAWAYWSYGQMEIQRHNVIQPSYPVTITISKKGYEYLKDTSRR